MTPWDAGLYCLRWLSCLWRWLSPVPRWWWWPWRDLDRGDMDPDDEDDDEREDDDADEDLDDDDDDGEEDLDEDFFLFGDGTSSACEEPYPYCAPPSARAAGGGGGCGSVAGDDGGVMLSQKLGALFCGVVVDVVGVCGAAVGSTFVGVRVHEVGLASLLWGGSSTVCLSRGEHAAQQQHFLQSWHTHPGSRRVSRRLVRNSLWRQAAQYPEHLQSLFVQTDRSVLGTSSPQEWHRALSPLHRFTWRSDISSRVLSE